MQSVVNYPIVWTSASFAGRNVCRVLAEAGDQLCELVDEPLGFVLLEGSARNRRSGAELRFLTSATAGFALSESER